MKYTRFLSAILFVLGIQAAWGQIPQTISYQGVLTDASGTAVPDGDYNLTFKLYDAATGRTELWSEDQSVEVSNGIFNVILGSITPLTLSFDKPYWLGVTVGQNSELTPRIELTASAYSLNARSIADSTVTGNKIASGQVVRSVNAIKDDVILAAGNNITITQDDNTLTIAAAGGAGGGNTLDQAYDQGGTGAGRQIIADAGAVDIAGPDGLSVEGNVGIGTTNLFRKLTVEDTDSQGTQDFFNAARINLTRTVADNVSLRNTQGLLVVTNYTSSTGTYFAPKAVEAWVENISAGEITEASALRGLVINRSTGSIELANGLYTRIENTSTGTIEQARSVFIASPFNTGTIENNYGLFIENQNIGPNSYAIYSVGGKSYFADAVGIGTANPANILTVVQGSDTDPIADAWTTYSSRRWKTNIQPMEGSLDKVKRLRGVSYDRKADGKPDIGLIAEEVGEVIPEVVSYEENGKDAKSVDYARLVAVLIEAMKEQQNEIKKQKATIDALVNRLTALEENYH
jgi:hypothetical protein